MTEEEPREQLFTITETAWLQALKDAFMAGLGDKEATFTLAFQHGWEKAWLMSEIMRKKAEQGHEFV